MKKILAFLVALSVPAASFADVVIKSGATSDTLTVDTNKNARVNLGSSTRATYIASASGLATTAAYGLAVESDVSVGFKVARICVGVTGATAAAGVTVTVRRTTAASSGGTALTSEGTGATSISKMDPADGSYGGVARAGAITTTNGPVLDQFGFMVGEIGAGTADVATQAPFCVDYGTRGEKMPTVVSGVANGVGVNVSIIGAGGLAFGSISMVLIRE